MLPKNMYKGLFINNKKAKDSIYESGLMIYTSLVLSAEYELDYQEIDIDNREIRAGYDFYFFNYHPTTMSWLDTKSLKRNLGFVIAAVLEVAPDDPFIFCSKKDFDAFCVIDPTIKQRKKVYPFPRPLEKTDFELPVVNNEVPVIGSFGFATKGKGFHHVVDAVNREFDRAVIRINIPFGDFVPDSEKYAGVLSDLCKKRAKRGIEVRVTHDFMKKNELIKWCASNTLNCFLYDRDLPGLAATTDQAIASGRPLAVSDNNTFRHITAVLPPYPRFSLKDSIERSIPLVKQLQEEWAPGNFAKKFEKILEENDRLINAKKRISLQNIILPLKQRSVLSIIESRAKKYKRKFKKINISKLFKRNDPKYGKEIM